MPPANSTEESARHWRWLSFFTRTFFSRDDWPDEDRGDFINIAKLSLLFYSHSMPVEFSLLFLHTLSNLRVIHHVPVIFDAGYIQAFITDHPHEISHPEQLVGKVKTVLLQNVLWMFRNRYLELYKGLHFLQLSAEDARDPSSVLEMLAKNIQIISIRARKLSALYFSQYEDLIVVDGRLPADLVPPYTDMAIEYIQLLQFLAQLYYHHRAICQIIDF